MLKLIVCKKGFVDKNTKPFLFIAQLNLMSISKYVKPHLNAHNVRYVK